MTYPKKLGFIGAGNMAHAIGEGLVQKGLIKPSDICVSAATDKSLEDWKQIGCKTTINNGDVVDFADIVFLAVKPYQLDSALENVKLTLPSSNANKLFVSVLAGTTLKTLEIKLGEALNQKQTRIIRSMPNTPMMVGEGCSVITPNMSATEEDTTDVCKIFSALGKCEVVPEYLISSFSGLAGSGPAYIYLVIEALSDGAVKKGMPREMATACAAQTVLGAAKMVLETKKHPGQLKDEVCSPGGTTIAAIHVLEKNRVRAAFIEAVEASVERGEQIGKQS